MRVSYTLRMPDNLRVFIEQESKKRGITTAAFVVNACWHFLEEPPESRATMQKVHNYTTRLGITKPHEPLKMFVPDASFGLQVPIPVRSEPFYGPGIVEMLEEVPKCKYTEYDGDSGETMACGLSEHGGKIKHGNWRKV